MDVDDDFLLMRGDERLYRRRGCRCPAVPIPPESGSGCRCPRCGASCLKCPGFGFMEHPVRRFHRILASVTSQIRRRLRQRGHEPGFIRLSSREIRVIVEKLNQEEKGHWTIKERWIDPGPPLLILGVFVVEDLRREDK
jgi:hypothetical protein